MGCSPHPRETQTHEHEPLTAGRNAGLRLGAIHAARDTGSETGASPRRSGSDPNTCNPNSVRRPLFSQARKRKPSRAERSSVDNARHPRLDDEGGMGMASLAHTVLADQLMTSSRRRPYDLHRLHAHRAKAGGRGGHSLVRQRFHQGGSADWAARARKFRCSRQLAWARKRPHTSKCTLAQAAKPNSSVMLRGIRQ